MSNDSTIPQDIVNAIEKFEEESTHIINKLDKLIYSKDLPPVIYHYTNDMGFRGILETGKLWLTDIFALNDPSELEYGLDNLRKEIKNKIDDKHPERNIIDWWFSKIKEKKEQLAFFCACSFSSSIDDLGQWRAYADSGRGFAIGFNTQILKDAFSTDNNTMICKTFPVTYNDECLTKMNKDLVEKFFYTPFERKEFLEEKLLKDSLFHLAWRSLYIALHFKHSAYRNEQEYRFLQMQSADPPPVYEKRCRNYSLINYREFDWRNSAPNAIKEIIIGPSADNKKKAYQFAKDCLQLAGIDSIEPTCSNIPYRAL